MSDKHNRRVGFSGRAVQYMRKGLGPADANLRMSTMPMLLLLACLLFGPTCRGAILQVPAIHPTIQEAVYAAANGDTIHVAPGIYYERLVLPDTSLTICSDDFFTGDSAAINTTILDGQHLGTLVLVNSIGNHVTRFHGMTLRNGQGTEENHLSYTGGIQLNRWANLHLSNVVLANHRGHGHGAVIAGHRLRQEPGRIILDNVHVITANTPIPDQMHEISFVSCQSLLVHRFRYTNGGSRASLINASGDTIIVGDVVIDGLDSESFVMGFQSEHILEATGFSITNSNADGSAVLHLNCDTENQGDYSRITDIQIDNCTRSTHIFDYSQYGPVLYMEGMDSLDVQRVTVRNCTSLLNDIVAIYGYGLVRNLLVEDNVAGADPGPYNGHDGCGSDCMGRIVSVSSANLEDVIIKRNRSILYPAGPLGINGSKHANGLALVYGGLGPRTFSLKRVIVQDHFTEDHENKLNLDIYHDPNTGRGLHLTVSYTVPRSTVVLEDCIFKRLQQPNMCLERPSNDPELDGRQVGSVVEISAEAGPLPVSYGRVQLRNILIEDSDDGGLVSGPIHHLSRVDARNVVVRNVSRLGQFYGADSLDLSNLLVDGVISWEAHYSYPYSWLRPTYQNALTLLFGEYNRLSNITLVNNATECLFWLWAGESVEYSFTLHNSLLWNNTCDWFVNPWYDITEFPPPDFRYSMLEDFQPGEGNLIGMDPWFDEELGAPWLSSISPAIDAGDQNPALNDREDPNNPGFALWPSQGTLRNDIGYTGGPHLFAIDTSWVALQRPKPRPVTQPQGFSLKPAYPNPFNPATTLSYTLDRPMRIELSVYNLLGQKVRTLVFGLQPAGEHSVPFIAGELASGVYVVELKAGGHSQTQKVLLLK